VDLCVTALQAWWPPLCAPVERSSLNLAFVDSRIVKLVIGLASSVAHRVGPRVLIENRYFVWKCFMARYARLALLVTNCTLGAPSTVPTPRMGFVINYTLCAPDTVRDCFAGLRNAACTPPTRLSVVCTPDTSALFRFVCFFVCY